MFKYKYSVFLIFLIAFFTGCAQQSVITSNGVSTGYANIDTANINNDILFYINQYRTSIGKPTLQMINAASEAATVHSLDMAKGIVPFGHEGFKTRIANIQTSFGSVHAAAENVAYGMLTAKSVVNGWLNSPPHKKNIEGDYTLTGIGIAKDKEGSIYFTQIFLLK